MSRIPQRVEFNKKHLTKAQKAARRAAELEVTVVEGAMSCPREVREKIGALKKWKELQKLHFLTPVDSSFLAAFCLAWAEYEDLLERLKRISVEGLRWEEEAEVEGDTYATAGERAAVRVWKKMDYILSQDGVLDLNKAINAKLTILTQLSDRLYINPRARAIIPKKEKPAADPLQAAGFGDL